MGEQPSRAASAPDYLTELLGVDALFTVKEFAKITKSSVPSMYRRMREGRLPYVMIGDSRRIKRETVLKILQEGLAPDSPKSGGR